MTVEQVLRAEREWLLAHLRLDVRVLDRLMAPEYAQIDDKGRVVDREQVLASFRSGERGWEEAHSDEHDVRVYWNTAAVVGRWRASGVNAGQPFRLRGALRLRVGQDRRGVADGQRPVDPDNVIYPFSWGRSAERSKIATPTTMAASAALKMYQKEKWT